MLEALEVVDVVGEGLVVDLVFCAAAFFFAMKEVDVYELFQVVGYGGLGEVEAFGDGGALGPFGVLPDVFEHFYAVGVTEGFAHALQSFGV